MCACCAESIAGNLHQRGRLCRGCSYLVQLGGRGGECGRGTDREGGCGREREGDSSRLSRREREGEAGRGKVREGYKNGQGKGEAIMDAAEEYTEHYVVGTCSVLLRWKWEGRSCRYDA